MYAEGQEEMLVSDNDEYPPIVVLSKNKNYSILGKVGTVINHL